MSTKVNFWSVCYYWTFYRTFYRILYQTFRLFLMKNFQNYRRKNWTNYETQTRIIMMFFKQNQNVSFKMTSFISEFSGHVHGPGYSSSRPQTRTWDFLRNRNRIWTRTRTTRVNDRIGRELIRGRGLRISQPVGQKWFDYWKAFFTFFRSVWILRSEEPTVWFVLNWPREGPSSSLQSLFDTISIM